MPLHRPKEPTTPVSFGGSFASSSRIEVERDFHRAMREQPAVALQILRRGLVGLSYHEASAFWRMLRELESQLPQQHNDT